MKDIFERVMNTSTIKEAALSLDVSVEYLQNFILSQGAIHPLGERWSKTVKDFLEAEITQQLSLDI